MLYAQNIRWLFRIGGENEGQKVAAATYLKNVIRRNIDANDANQKLSKEFRDALVRVLLQTEPAILRVLNEAVRVLGIAFCSLGNDG